MEVVVVVMDVMKVLMMLVELMVAGVEDMEVEVMVILVTRRWD